MKVWIGTSGYSYPDWVGKFYPRGTRGQAMLPKYCSSFPIVELNFTFYRVPTPAMLARLADKTPAAFQFLVKLPRSLSHEGRADELDLFQQAVDELKKRNQLMGLLCQLPQACHDEPRHRSWVEWLGLELGSRGLAVEFRHQSWNRPEVADWLGQRGLDLVAVDVPMLPSLYPRGLVHSTSRVYIRFHSRMAENWYLSDKDRYDYAYTDAELSEWIEALRGHPELDRVLLLFNNCQRSQAAESALRMQKLLQERGAEFEVVEPFGQAQSKGLFD